MHQKNKHTYTCTHAHTHTHTHTQTWLHRYYKHNTHTCTHTHTHAYKHRICACDFPLQAYKHLFINHKNHHHHKNDSTHFSAKVRTRASLASTRSSVALTTFSIHSMTSGSFHSKKQRPTYRATSCCRAGVWLEVDSETSCYKTHTGTSTAPCTGPLAAVELVSDWKWTVKQSYKALPHTACVSERFCYKTFTGTSTAPRSCCLAESGQWNILL